MASELAIYYTPMHFMWGVKSGATPGPNPDLAPQGEKYYGGEYASLNK